MVEKPQIILIIIAFAVVALLGVGFFLFQPKMINAYFESGTLQPKQNTTLVVEVHNTLDKDVGSVRVNVRALDPTSIQVLDEKSAVNLAKGDSRKFQFPVRVSSDALEGRYNIEVQVSLDDNNETIRIGLEIKK